MEVPLNPLSGEFDGDSPDKTPADSAVVSWESKCVSWGGADQEQILQILVLSVNGENIRTHEHSEEADTGVTVRFRQAPPARIVVVEGAASVFLFNDNYYDLSDKDNEAAGSTEHDSSESEELSAWESSVIDLQHHIDILEHEIALRKQYIASRFGPSAPSPHRKPCGSAGSFIGTIFRKIHDSAKVLYDDLVGSAAEEEDADSASPDAADGHAHLSHPAHWPWPFPHCSPRKNHTHHKPPPPPPPPPVHLIHVPTASPASSTDQPAPPAHQVPPFSAASRPAGAEGDSAGNSEKESAPEGSTDDRGPKMKGYGVTGPAPTTAQHESTIETVFFLILIVVLLFFIARRCHQAHGHRRGMNGRRDNFDGDCEDYLQMVSNRVQDVMRRREERRERRRRIQESIRGLIRGFKRRLFASSEDEKLAESGSLPTVRPAPRVITPGHIVTNTPPPSPPVSPPASSPVLQPADHQRSTSFSLEQDIAAFRAAADVVGQLIAAEEGRASMDLTQAASIPPPLAVPPPPASSTPARKSAPSAPPRLQAAESSRSYSSFHRHDASGIDSDFDDTESLPPAYTSEDESCVRLVEASVIADGFQYSRNSRP